MHNLKQITAFMKMIGYRQNVLNSNIFVPDDNTAINTYIYYHYDNITKKFKVDRNIRSYENDICVTLNKLLLL